MQALCVTTSPHRCLYFITSFQQASKERDALAGEVGKIKGDLSARDASLADLNVSTKKRGLNGGRRGGFWEVAG